MHSETNELLKQIITKLGNIEGTVCRRGKPWPCGQGARQTGSTDKQACRHRTGSTSEQAPLIATATRLASLGGYRWHWTGGEGRRGPQTAFMAKQRKVFLEYLKVHPETASVSRITRARECWAIHRKEWDAAAKKGIGYADYKVLSRAKLM